MNQNYNLNNLRIVKNWRKVFKKDFALNLIKNNDKIFYDFLKVIKINSYLNLVSQLKKCL